MSDAGAGSGSAAKRSSRRKGQSSRQRMHAERSRAPEINPAPPGSRGGQYKPLSATDIARIFDTAFRMLEELGMGDAPPLLIELCFSRSMVEDIVAGACKSFTFHGRDDKHTIEVGGERVYFGTGGAAVQTLDLGSGRYRPSTLVDLYDFTRLVDTLDNVSWFTPIA